MRQVVLDTETTGLDAQSGHRIIEIGCVEMIERRLTGNNLHIYLQPDRQIDHGAMEVHGISNEFLSDKPRFEDVATEVLDYLKGAELVIHNADFDVGFLDAEFARVAGNITINSICRVIDTLALARKLYPGQRNSLDALCKRMDVNNSHRTLHGALLDSEILADVYLRMTGGQTALLLDEDNAANAAISADNTDKKTHHLKLVEADEVEMRAHDLWLDKLANSSDAGCVWRNLDQG
ncbi:MAG: DNA polymerase III subunit epsilon [Granulosicoccaceae bacterium]